jgi:hypothetical protein
MKLNLLNMLSMLVLLGLAVVFGLSSVMKAMDVGSFETIIEAHGVLPKQVVPAASITVMGVEVLLAMLCIGAVLLELTTSKPIVEASAGHKKGKPSAGLTAAKRTKLNRLTLWALVSAGCLLTLFTIYALALAILTKEPVECGCSVFGKSVVLPKWIAIRNAIAAALVFATAIAMFKRRGSTP